MFDCSFVFFLFRKHLVRTLQTVSPSKIRCRNMLKNSELINWSVSFGVTMLVEELAGSRNTWWNKREIRAML